MLARLKGRVPLASFSIPRTHSSREMEGKKRKYEDSEANNGGLPNYLGIQGAMGEEELNLLFLRELQILFEKKELSISSFLAQQIRYLQIDVDGKCLQVLTACS